MSGIAKSASVDGKPYVVPAPVHKDTTSISTTTYDNIPVDVYRFFGTQLGEVSDKDMDKLSLISDYAFREVETVGDGLLKLRNLEMKLGSPSLGEKRYDRIFNWVKLQKNIDDMRKRQEALRRL
jgi:hypothetical protein